MSGEDGASGHQTYTRDPLGKKALSPGFDPQLRGGRAAVKALCGLAFSASPCGRALEVRRIDFRDPPPV